MYKLCLNVEVVCEVVDVVSMIVLIVIEGKECVMGMVLVMNDISVLL